MFANLLSEIGQKNNAFLHSMYKSDVSYTFHLGLQVKVHRFLASWGQEACKHENSNRGDKVATSRDVKPPFAMSRAMLTGRLATSQTPRTTSRNVARGPWARRPRHRYRAISTSRDVAKGPFPRRATSPNGHFHVARRRQISCSMLLATSRDVDVAP